MTVQHEALEMNQELLPGLCFPGPKNLPSPEQHWLWKPVPQVDFKSWPSVI